MKYLLAAAVLAAGLFGMTGTASAQHYSGGHHGNTYAHGPSHGGYTAPRVGVYAVPTYSGPYQPGYSLGAYSRPVYSGPVHGGYVGHGYNNHNTHHDRHGHR